MITHIAAILDMYKSQMQQQLRVQNIDIDLFHCRVISVLNGNMTTTPQHIAAELGRDRAQITRAVNGLIKSGFIIRSPNPADARSVWLTLSDKGRQLAVNIFSAEQRVTDGIFGVLTDAEKEALRNMSLRLIHCAETKPEQNI